MRYTRLVTNPSNQPRTVPAALTRGRIAVDTFSSTWLAQGNPAWPEETATVTLLMSAYPEVRYCAFTHHEEKRVGADWLWWFWDSRTREAFGVLAQAKNVKRNGSRYSIDYTYNKGDQLETLLNAAYELRLPAIYVLYCGNLDYRCQLHCDQEHSDPIACTRRPEASVSVLPALLAQEVSKNEPAATLAAASMHVAVPLEDITSWTQQPQLRPPVRQLDREVLEFLALPQEGARLVAKRLLAVLYERRQRGHYWASAPGTTRLDLPDAVFSGPLPDDQGHFSRPYYPHVLRGLRRSLPDYVQRSMQTHQMPEGPGFDGMDGMTIVMV